MARQQTPDQIFVNLVDTYLDRVFRYLCNLTRDEDAARGFCHEAFLSLRKKVDQGAEISEAYVFTTARNAAISSWRSERREEEKKEAWSLDQENHAPPSSRVEDSELGQALEAAIGLLSEEHRTVFLLSEVDGMKYEKIAEVLGISAGTVASRKFKAVRVMRKELKRLGHAMS